MTAEAAASKQHIIAPISQVLGDGYHFTTLYMIESGGKRQMPELITD